MRQLKLNVLLRFINSYIVDSPQPANLSYLWNFGSLLATCLGLQIVTGIFLAMHYIPNVDLAFASVEHIMRDVNNGWAVRYTHANVASFFFIFVYAHIARGLYYSSYKTPRVLVWSIGVIILIVMMATAFLGYVLPYGQMSLWGATVITNLLSAIPFFGQDLVELIWGGFSVNNATLNRFFSLHYLLPFLLAALAIAHLIALHTHGSNNPNGLLSTTDRYPMHPYFTFKDLVTIFLFFLVLSIIVFYYPNLLGHSDNYIPANPMQTPASIVPEWYLLPFYAILRSIPDKLLGVIAMFGSLLILLILPIIESCRFRSTQIRPLMKTAQILLYACLICLGWVGAKHPTTPFVEIGQLATAFYFSWFLIIVPALGLFDNTVFDLSSDRLEKVKATGRSVGFFFNQSQTQPKLKSGLNISLIWTQTKTYINKLVEIIKSIFAGFYSIIFMFFGLIFIGLFNILKSASKYLFYKYPNQLVFFLTFPFLCDISPVLCFLFYYYLLVYSLLCSNLIVNLVIFIPEYIDSFEGLVSDLNNRLIENFISEGLSDFNFNIIDFVDNHYCYADLQYEYSDLQVGDLNYPICYNAEAMIDEIPHYHRRLWVNYIKSQPEVNTLKQLVYLLNIKWNSLPFHPDQRPLGILGGYDYRERYYDYVDIFRIGLASPLNIGNLELLAELRRFPFMDPEDKAKLMQLFYEKESARVNALLKEQLSLIASGKFTMSSAFETLKLIKYKLGLINIAEVYNHNQNCHYIDSWTLDSYKLEPDLIVNKWRDFIYQLDDPYVQAISKEVISEKLLTAVLGKELYKHGYTQLFNYIDMPIELPVDYSKITLKIGDFSTGLGLLAKSSPQITGEDSTEVARTVKALRFHRLCTKDEYLQHSPINDYDKPNIADTQIITQKALTSAGPSGILTDQSPINSNNTNTKLITQKALQSPKPGPSGIMNNHSPIKNYFNSADTILTNKVLKSPKLGSSAFINDDSPSNNYDIRTRTNTNTNTNIKRITYGGRNT